MTKDRKNIPPAKLFYKGSEYHLAITDAGNVWKNQIAPRLEALFELASDGDTEDQIKKERARNYWYELKEYFRLLGLH